MYITRINVYYKLIYVHRCVQTRTLFVFTGTPRYRPVRVRNNWVLLKNSFYTFVGIAEKKKTVEV